LIEEAGFPGEILPRRRGIAVMAAVGDEQEIDAVAIGGTVRRNLDRQPGVAPRLVPARDHANIV
jgi:hypothetical protein